MVTAERHEAVRGRRGERESCVRGGGAGKRLDMWAVTVVVVVALVGVSPLPPPPSCTHLQGAYTARGVSRSSLPHTPVPGTV